MKSSVICGAILLAGNAFVFGQTCEDFFGGKMPTNQTETEWLEAWETRTSQMEDFVNIPDQCKEQIADVVFVNTDNECYYTVTLRGWQFLNCRSEGTSPFPGQELQPPASMVVDNTLDIGTISSQAIGSIGTDRPSGSIPNLDASDPAATSLYTPAPAGPPVESIGMYNPKNPNAVISTVVARPIGGETSEPISAGNPNTTEDFNLDDFPIGVQTSAETEAEFAQATTPGAVTSQVTARPVQATPVQSTPVQSTPVQSTPVQARPIEVAPVASPAITSNANSATSPQQPNSIPPITQSTPVQANTTPQQSAPVSQAAQIMRQVTDPPGGGYKGEEALGFAEGSYKGDVSEGIGSGDPSQYYQGEPRTANDQAVGTYKADVAPSSGEPGYAGSSDGGSMAGNPAIDYSGAEIQTPAGPNDYAGSDVALAAPAGWENARSKGSTSTPARPATNTNTRPLETSAPVQVAPLQQSFPELEKEVAAAEENFAKASEKYSEGHKKRTAAEEELIVAKNNLSARQAEAQAKYDADLAAANASASRPAESVDMGSTQTTPIEQNWETTNTQIADPIAEVNTFVPSGTVSDAPASVVNDIGDIWTNTPKSAMTYIDSLLLLGNTKLVIDDYPNGNAAYQAERNRGYNAVTIAGGDKIYFFDQKHNHYRDENTILIPDKVSEPNGHAVEANSFYGYKGGKPKADAFQWDSKQVDKKHQPVGYDAKWDPPALFVSPISPEPLNYCQVLNPGYQDRCRAGSAPVTVEGPYIYPAPMVPEATQIPWEGTELIEAGKSGGSRFLVSQQPVSNSYCEKNFGKGWRMPTAYEMGFGVDVPANDGGFALDPAYQFGNKEDYTIWSSCVISSNIREQVDFRYAYNVVMGRDYGWAASPTVNKSSLRCVYSTK